MAGAVAVSGCGASQVVDPVAKAASTTLSSGGYKMSGVMSVTGAASPVTASMAGVIDPVANSGTMTIDETVGGQRVHGPMVFSSLSFWMKSSAIAGAASRTGKPWIYIDMSKALGAMGVGSLPSTIDPSQFLNYLNAVGASPTRVGPVSIHGVHTTEYRAVIDLNRYAQQNNIPAKTITSLESAMGTHTMPVEAWIDTRNRIRRIHVAFPECVAGTRLQFSMTMGIYGFGTQPRVQIPSRNAVYNLTPILAAQAHTLKLGCSSAG
jgi:hypothetical protein